MSKQDEKRSIKARCGRFLKGVPRWNTENYKGSPEREAWWRAGVHEALTNNAPNAEDSVKRFGDEGNIEKSKRGKAFMAGFRAVRGMDEED